ncbi:Branched-chain amino acid aminotransferase/4-amino-4-deoxychorismate lyase [Promicromonospora umidemergens]|uniref:Aminotransferase class IV family protein n=1 Tax=Promicromonospora umidemergens TaxID=629679 RepID=A0ABP8XTU4_9MICO|nr:aminotransferase class IV family protein [Promicromonospora umidemergens]MCP2286304.1 Branched-chain amino acid aminotransferase/4-amino-4-deoxychorismate lyase [Promicromonospora umidemergens]
MTISITQFNSRSADAADLAPLAFSGYAHFTAMQVRDGRVRGMDLHLARLRDASDELFGWHLPDEMLLERLHSALATAPSDVSMTCFVTSRPGEFASTGGSVDLDVLVKITDPAAPPTGPLSLDVVEHERHLPHVKHVGEVSKTLLLRRANERGFDDAAFTDRSGRLSEATIWNLAFWDGESVIWPRAEILAGVTMQILDRRLRALSIPQQTRDVPCDELGGHFSAVVMNSWTPGISIARIGDTPLGQDAEFVRLLHSAHDDEPLESV